MYEDLIRKLRQYADEYRSGDTLGRMIEDTEDVVETAASAIETLSQHQPQWINVKDKLPEDSEDVLFVVCPNGEPFVRIGCYNEKQKAWQYLDGIWTHSVFTSDIVWPVTHWMPLPELPKENET